MTTTKQQVTIPAVMRGQVLAQYTGYLVRGQYVVGGSHVDGWFWYDVYGGASAYGLKDAQAALDSLGLMLARG